MNRNFSNIGNDIMDIVSDAVNSRDFHQLNRNIANTVDDAMDELKRSMGGQVDRENKKIHYDPTSANKKPYESTNKKEQTKWTGQWTNPHASQQTNQWKNDKTKESKHYDYYESMGNKQQYHAKTSTTYGNHKNSNVSPQYTVFVGRISGILYTVFGSLLGFGCGIAILVLATLGLILNLSLLFTIASGLIPPFLIGVLLFIVGGSYRKRLKRFRSYLLIMGNKNYFMIKDLALHTSLSTKALSRDLSKMIRIGMFPEGHLDDKKTCFMLNHESYSQYLKLKENMHTNQNTASNKTQKTANEKTDTTESTANNELSQMIEEGRSYVHQIREANDELPGVEISKKLDQLEKVTSKIFDYVSTHPEQLPDIQKFMAYYLPTTAKLLIAYREFEAQPIQGEHIKAAKEEIETTIDTINLAFEKLLDSLFQDAAMDVSSDISVLQTMLKQEGLGENDFK